MTEPRNTPFQPNGQQQYGRDSLDETSTTDAAKQQAGALKDTAQNEAATVKDEAAFQAADVKDHAVAEAQNVKDTAVGGAQQVADTARVEVSQVAAEARDQIRGLVETTRGEVFNRAADGQLALAGTLETLTSELAGISRGETTSGPVNQLVQELATRGENLTTWLQSREPEDVLVEVRRYAARRPVTFLALAAGAGMIAGRLARGTRDLAQQEKEAAERAERRRQARAQTPVRGYQTTGYQTTGYQATGYQAPGYQAPVADRVDGTLGTPATSYGTGQGGTGLEGGLR